MNRDLAERVLAKLGLETTPDATLAGLTALYAAWCRKVPFDNVRKLIHVRSGDTGTLPGDRPDEFFSAWLAHGCGATCWAGNGALHALLEALGFSARRAVATMVAAPDLPPNHGSVVVALDGIEYVVDASILHVEPLRMQRAENAGVDHPAWGVSARWEERRFVVRWRNFLTPEPMDCVFNSVGADAAEFSQRHEMTREWSPFNFGLSLNLVRDGGRIGAAWGKTMQIDDTGTYTETLADLDARRRFLIEVVGMSEEIVSLLPDDVPMQPPPR